MISNIVRGAIALQLIVLLFTPTNAGAQSYFPATGIFNGFLNQRVISECENTNATSVNITMTVTDSAGSVLATHAYSISGSGSAHVILNDIADITDKIGVYTLTIPASQIQLGDSVNCRTSFYRAAPPGSVKAFDYAYVLPVENPKVGELSGIYNSIDPSNAGNVTSNWLSIINRSTSTFNGSVEVRGADGALLDTVSVSGLAPLARTDIPLGHPSGQVTGVYTIKPTNPSQLYDAVLVRYNPSPTGYNFAFPLQAISAACTGNPVSVSTMNNGWTNPWVETANLGAVDAVIDLTVRDRDGNVLHSEQRTIAPYQKYDFFAGTVIDPAVTGNVGSVQVSCADPTDRVLVQATHYGRDVNSTQIRWAYSSQVRGNSPADINSSLVLPVNTFAGIYNWGKLSDASGNGGALDWDIFDYLGNNVASGLNSLPAGGTIDHDLHTPMGADSVGFVKYSTTGASTQFNGEVLRVTLRTDNSDIATITPIPGVVKQNGDNGSFVGNPQSLAPYRDKLTTNEAVRFLQATEFGGSLLRIQQVKSAGLKASVDSMLDCVDNSDSQNISSNPAAEAYDWMDNVRDNTFSGLYSVQGLERYWLTYMYNTKCPLKEKLAFMLADRFAANCDVLANILSFPGGGLQQQQEWKYCKNHLDLLRSHAAGDYRDLAQKMSVSELMLVWLNGDANQCNPSLGAAPDQNWARENWELFSAGANNGFGAGMKNPLYTQTDIIRASGAAAGNQIVYNSSLGRNIYAGVSPQLHCGQAITLWEGTPFETTQSFDAESLATSLFDYRPRDAGRYVGSMIFNTFCHAYPGEQIKNQLAEMLEADGWVMDRTIRTVLKSEACFSSLARNSRIKDPLTQLLSFVKATKLDVLINDVNRSRGLYTELVNMMGGEGLLRPRDVFGFKGAALRDKDSVESQYNNGFATQYLNGITNLYNENATDFVGPDAFDWCSLLPSPTASGEEVVDQIAGLFGVALTDDQRDKLVEYMDYTETVAGNPPVYTQVPTLFDGRIASHCKNKVSGLMWIIASMPTVITF